MGPLESIGWRGLEIAPNPKWLAVKDLRVPKEVTTARGMGDIHLFVRGHIKYQKEALGSDSWQKPADTLALGLGDCEDFCILERALLLNAGYRNSRIELMVVKDILTREDHALLWVDEHYLDNRTAQVLHVSQFKDYRPITGHRADKSYLYGRIVK